MSLRITTRDDLDGVALQINAEGVDDVYRLLWLLLNGQSEFSALAQGPKGFAWLRKALGAKVFDSVDKTFTGGRAKRFAVDPMRDDQ